MEAIRWKDTLLEKIDAVAVWVKISGPDAIGQLYKITWHHIDTIKGWFKLANAKNKTVTFQRVQIKNEENANFKDEPDYKPNWVTEEALVVEVMGIGEDISVKTLLIVRGPNALAIAQPSESIQIITEWSDLTETKDKVEKVLAPKTS